MRRGQKAASWSFVRDRTLRAISCDWPREAQAHDRDGQHRLLPRLQAAGRAQGNQAHRPGEHQARPGGCQSASKSDPRSASKIDPPPCEARTVALAPAELVGVAQPGRARFGEVQATLVGQARFLKRRALVPSGRCAGQSRPKPRGGTMAWSSVRSRSQIASNASAVALSCRVSGRASSQAAY